MAVFESYPVQMKIAFPPKSDWVCRGFSLAMALAGLFSASANAFIPLNLTGSVSGNDFNLLLPTTTTGFYSLQSSTDLVEWCNTQSGIIGDGTVKVITQSNALSETQRFYRAIPQRPVSLILPQNAAFGVLGYDCGGINEYVTAGFSAVNGLPTGVVQLSTSCSGSGRGGHGTTHTATALVTWDLAGNVYGYTSLGTNQLGPIVSVDGLGDVIYNPGGVAYLLIPTPTKTVIQSAVQSGDQFQVSWISSGVNPQAIQSTVLIATPVNSSAPVLSMVISGPTQMGVIPNVQPQTRYLITAVSSTANGAGPVSAPYSLTSSPATILPGAPQSVSAIWNNLNPTGNADVATASWQASDPGNSPVDEYLVTFSGSDGAGTFTQTVSGTWLSLNYNLDPTPNWNITVQAHNAAGWGPVSNPFFLGGL